MGPQNLAAARFPPAAAKKSGSSKTRQPQNPAAAKSSSRKIRQQQNPAAAKTGSRNNRRPQESDNRRNRHHQSRSIPFAGRKQAVSPRANGNRSTQPNFPTNTPWSQDCPEAERARPPHSPFHTAPTTCELHLASPTPTTLRSPADSHRPPRHSQPQRAATKPTPSDETRRKCPTRVVCQELVIAQSWASFVMLGMGRERRKGTWGR